jgi:hypothetical protein
MFVQDEMQAIFLNMDESTTDVMPPPSSGVGVGSAIPAGEHTPVIVTSAASTPLPVRPGHSPVQSPVVKVGVVGQDGGTGAEREEGEDADEIEKVGEEQEEGMVVDENIEAGM